MNEETDISCLLLSDPSNSKTRQCLQGEEGHMQMNLTMKLSNAFTRFWWGSLANATHAVGSVLTLIYFPYQLSSYEVHDLLSAIGVSFCHQPLSYVYFIIYHSMSYGSTHKYIHIVTTQYDIIAITGQATLQLCGFGKWLWLGYLIILIQWGGRQSFGVSTECCQRKVSENLVSFLCMSCPYDGLFLICLIFFSPSAQY